MTFWSSDALASHFAIVNGTTAFLHEVQHYFSGHVMPLASVPVSCDVNGIVNGTTAFPRSRK